MAYPEANFYIHLRKIEGENQIKIVAVIKTNIDAFTIFDIHMYIFKHRFWVSRIMVVLR